MTKCVVCKTGTMVESGCHQYCDTCNFSLFVVTEGYIDSCIVVLSEVISNTKFLSTRDAVEFVLQNIHKHLPMLSNWINTVVQHEEDFVNSIMTQIVDQAINVQIDNQQVSRTSAESDLVCSCGCTKFIEAPTYPKQIVCEQCNALYEFDFDHGIYTPYFLCVCGNTTFNQEDGSSLVDCAACHKLYIHNEVDKSFMEVTTG